MTIPRQAATLVLLALCCLIAGYSRAEHLDVYILTGQSNSLGTTNLEGPAFDPGVHPADAATNFFWSNASTASSDPNNIVLYGDSAGAITTLQMQQGQGTNPNFWGPEFGLARTLADSGASNVLVIKASRGGGGNGFWLPNTGHMHGHLLAQIDAGLTAAQNAGHTFEVKGFMYLQGESNGGSEAAAADSRLQTLIDDVRSHINTGHAGAASSMYSVVGEIAASTSNANRTLTTTLQQTLAADSDAIGFVATRDQPLKSDGIHFGKEPKLEIGRRFADAFNSQTWIEHPIRLAGYSANFGSLDAIPHPIAQQLSGGNSAPAVRFGTFNDAGVPSWRMIDNNPRTSNPSIRETLDATDFERMFEKGWEFEVTARVATGGGIAFWSAAQANDPGWGLHDPSLMSGVELRRVNGDELEVALVGDPNFVNLGPGSADRHHTFALRGGRLSSRFDFFIDGVLQSTGNDLTSAAGAAGFEDTLLFGTGLGAATGVEIYWNKVSLFAVPEPATFTLMAWSFGLLATGRRPRHA